MRVCVCVCIKSQRHRQQSGIARENGGGDRWQWAKGAEMGAERDLAWGDGHTLQNADDVLLSCTLETYTPKNSIKKITPEKRHLVH